MTATMPIREATQSLVSGRCGACGRDADRRCSRCHEVFYCDRDHQHAHWPDHKAFCSPYKVAVDKRLGRHLVSTRDLPAGSRILLEPPLSTFPPSDAKDPMCVGCYTPLPSPPPLCPAGCGWPICGPHCTGAPRHAGECALQRARGRGPLGVTAALASGAPVWRALAIARCLLLSEEDPNAYEKLRGLEDHTKLRKETGQWAQDEELAKFMLPFFGLEGRYTEDDVLNMAGVLQVNSYPVRLHEPPPFSGIYSDASFIEHACVPNTAKVFDSDGSLLLRTVAPVKRGEHLSICYVQASLGTGERRKCLKEELLECTCPRCIDSTEHGTNFNAITCSDSSCKGVVLPIDPLNDKGPSDANSTKHSQESVWRCNTCGNNTPGSTANSLLFAAKQASTTLSPTMLLAQAAALRLAPSNYVLLPARIASVVATTDAIKTCSDADLSSTQRHIEELRGLVDKLLSAEVGLRGRLALAHFLVLREREVRCSCSNGLSGKDAIPHLEDTVHLLEDAISLLTDHADSSEEGRRLKQALSLFESCDFPRNTLHPLKSKDVTTNGTTSATTTPVAATAAAS